MFYQQKKSSSRSYPCSICQIGSNHALLCITTIGTWYIFRRRLYTMPPKLPTHPRSWGDASPLLFPVQSLHNVLNTTDTTFLVKQREDKLPHDASVFVGRWDYPQSSIMLYCLYTGANEANSLPSNIEHMDLTRMLMEHLSEHTQIKNIKVVRDSKGGVCAFVQCEVRGFFYINFVVKKTHVYMRFRMQPPLQLWYRLCNPVPPSRF